MNTEKAIKYFEEEIRFCENAPALNGCEMTGDWILILEMSKAALVALKEKQARESNPYWLRICELADKQRAKGIRTYGKGLEDNPLSAEDRLTYLEEELVDALMYIEHIKAGNADDFVEVSKIESHTTVNQYGENCAHITNCGTLDLHL